MGELGVLGPDAALPGPQHGPRGARPPPPRRGVRAPAPRGPGPVVWVQDYLGGVAGAVEWRFGQVAAWRDRHRQTVLVGELGGAQTHAENRSAWAGDPGPRRGRSRGRA